MVAYSFKQRFVAPILDGSKTQTIRAPRARHARVGEELQLYTGMRTKQCKLIRRAECIDVQDIRLRFDRDDVTTASFYLATPVELDDFARKDGFANWEDMKSFWGAEHATASIRFEGVLIRWTR